MDPRELLAIKRDGGALSSDQSAEFLSAYTRGEIADYQAAVLLTSIYIHDMTDAELAGWARGMIKTGSTLSFKTERPIVDKHSTGGVGDKVSIPLAPALVACGCCVPMISGRGLGHTGGTLDKMESIEGLSTEFSADKLQGLIDEAGFFIAAQTEDLVPADKLLYALRDVTGLVASPPLISSSILSKKLAEGLDALILDIKVGSGSFLTTPAAAADVRRRMGVIAADFDLPITIIQTSMAAPLGLTVGHALEIRESLECLRGEGPTDLRELVELEGGELLRLVGLASDRGAGQAQIAAALDDGSALAAFRKGVVAQGGAPEAVDNPEALPTAPDKEDYLAQGDGHLSFADCAAVGRAVSALGGGRRRLEDPIDHAVGLVFKKRPGDPVRSGEALCVIHHRGGKGLEEARAHLDAALSLTLTAEVEPLVLDA
jgi:pyrimidine-nucleoside phosphorylase